MSIVCGSLVQCLENQQDATFSAFFCGFLCSLPDAPGSPESMIRTLISQILRQCPAIDFRSISRGFHSLLEIPDPTVLFDCFVQSVRLLPNNTVLFCVIDGISFFERDQSINLYLAVFNRLYNLTLQDDLPVIFKMLFTSSEPSKYIWKIFSDDCRLRLPLRDLLITNQSSRQVRNSEWQGCTVNQAIGQPRPLQRSNVADLPHQNGDLIGFLPWKGTSGHLKDIATVPKIGTPHMPCGLYDQNSFDSPIVKIADRQHDALTNPFAQQVHRSGQDEAYQLVCSRLTRYFTSPAQTFSNMTSLTDNGTIFDDASSVSSLSRDDNHCGSRLRDAD